MHSISQVQKIVDFLKEHPKKSFNGRQIAEAIILKYPDDYQEKRSNPRFNSEADFISQVVAEIGSQKDAILKKNSKIQWRDKPRPRVYWYDPETSDDEALAVDQETPAPADTDESDTESIQSIPKLSVFNEEQLYPILIDYLKLEKRLYCQRINEKRSKNNRGKGGNHWLHPDIVAMQPIDKAWHELVRTCIDQANRIRLWSFEVKKVLNTTNVRESFFQAVSNSSWANEGYLVTTDISSNAVESELRMLSALHGIGVILLDTENSSESEILLPSKSRSEIDWQSVNRILLENGDFKDYIELVSMYYQTGLIRDRDWNRM
jgi:hypothetical protein